MNCLCCSVQPKLWVLVVLWVVVFFPSCYGILAIALKKIIPFCGMLCMSLKTECLEIKTKVSSGINEIQSSNK